MQCIKGKIIVVPNHSTTADLKSSSALSLNSVSKEFCRSSSTSEYSSTCRPKVCHEYISKGSISGLRATMIQPFSNKYAPWPLLAWKEGDDIDVMAIFKVSNSVAPCSCHMHYGVGRCWGEQGKRGQSRILRRWYRLWRTWKSYSSSLGMFQGSYDRRSWIREVLGRVVPELSTFRSEISIDLHRLSKHMNHAVNQVSRLKQWTHDFKTLGPHLENYNSKEDTSCKGVLTYSCDWKRWTSVHFDVCVYRRRVIVGVNT